MDFRIKNSIRPRRNIKTPESSRLFSDGICLVRAVLIVWSEAACDPDDLDETFRFSSVVVAAVVVVVDSDFDSSFDFCLLSDLLLISKDSSESAIDVDFIIFIDSLRANLKVVYNILLREIIWNAPKNMWKMILSCDSIWIIIWNAQNRGILFSVPVLKLITC